MEINLSEYASQLEGDVKLRYFKKIKKIGFDPYFIDSMNPRDWCTDIKSVPKVKYSTIHNYLVLRKSYYNKTEFEAKKALYSYDLTACGWVSKFKWEKATTSTALTIIVCQVLHSMKLNDPALMPWVIYNPRKFAVVSAHCNCMAGQGEACSHIGALLFYALVAGKSNKERPSVTGNFAYWMLPTAQKKQISPKKMKEIVLKKPVRGTSLPAIQESYASVPLKPYHFPKRKVSTSEELKKFLKELRDTSSINSTVFSVVAPFNQQKEENENDNSNLLQKNFPSCSVGTTAPLSINTTSSSFDPTVFISSKRTDILSVTDLNSLLQQPTENEINFYNKFVKITATQATDLFNSTVQQSLSTDWKRYRQIRITGSVFYSLYTYMCGTVQNWTQKIDGVIFPTFSGNTATRYGNDNEKHVLDIFKKKHPAMQLIRCGLLVNVSYPFLGFSPDAVAIEDGKYTLIEVKCPQLGQSHGGIELCKLLDYTIVKGKDVKLKQQHKYFGQIQLGLFLCGIKSCVLLIYSEKLADAKEVEVELDEDFCKKFVPALKKVYFQYFLPYLVQHTEHLLINLS